MNTLKFQKPRVDDLPLYQEGRRVIRYSYASASHAGPVPGRYLITSNLRAYFLAEGQTAWDRGEFVCEVKLGSELPGDRIKNARSRGRFLWTSAAMQRSLTKLYALLRKDWETRRVPLETNP